MTNLLKLSRDVLLTMEKFQVDLYFNPWTKIEVHGIVKCHPLEGHHPRQPKLWSNHVCMCCYFKSINIIDFKVNQDWKQFGLSAVGLLIN